MEEELARLRGENAALKKQAAASSQPEDGGQRNSFAFASELAVASGRCQQLIYSCLRPEQRLAPLAPLLLHTLQDQGLRIKLKVQDQDLQIYVWTSCF